LAAGTTQGNVQTWDAARGYEIAAGQRRGELAWEYYDLAHSSTGEGRLAALREALRHAPDTMAFWTLRANIRAILGEFEQAADEFAKLTPTDLRESLLAALFRAECLHAAGNNLGFQQQCQALVAAFGADPILSTRKYLIACCTRTPLSSVDTAELVKIANVPVEDSEDQEDQRDRLYYVGLSLLRDGKYEEATRILTSLNEGYLPGGNAQNHINQAYTLYFLALARYHLGHVEQAQRIFLEANEHAAQAGDLEWNWRARVKLGSLRDEVSAALAP
jgi:tetratricopeptide (TPR) repeat protein